MTPKEKALSLCQQFGSTTKFAEDCNEGKTLPLRIAKLCATIAVEEIFNVYKTLSEDDDIMFPYEIKYWEQVKQEFEKL